MGVVSAPAETDQPSQLPLETEGAESVPAPEAAAPQVEEGAAAESVATPEYVTREDLERIRAEEREQARRDAAEQLRRENQRRNALAAREKAQEQEARDRAHREARMALHEQGLTVEPETVTPAFDSYVKTYRSAYERAVESDATDGFVLAAADVLGVPVPADLEPSERAYTYADGVKTYVKGLYDQAYARAKSDLAKDYIPKSELPAIQEGWLKKLRTDQKPSEDFAGVEGAPAAASGGLTADQYAAMSPVEQRRLQRERPDLINAMTRRLQEPQR